VDFKAHPKGRSGLFQIVKLHMSGHRGLGRFQVPRWDGRLKTAATVSFHNAATVPQGRDGVSHDQLKSRGLPSGVLINAREDSHGPVLTDLSISHVHVDTTRAARPVAIAVAVKDDLSGVASVVAQLTPRDGHHDFTGATDVDLVRHGHHWTGTATIERCVIAGRWTLGITSTDRAGHRHRVNHTVLVNSGLPSGISVASDPPGDLSHPIISNSGASALSHTITMRFDEGVKGATTSNFTVYDAADGYASPLLVSAVHCANGSTSMPCDGSHGIARTVTLQVPGLTATHSYEVYANQNSVIHQVTDAAGNTVDWLGALTRDQA